MKFLLKDLFGIGKKYKIKKNIYLDDDTVDSILEEVSKLAEDIISPINRDGDLYPAILKNGEVVLPESFSTAYNAIAEGGWIGISGKPKYGGLGLPLIITTCVNEIFI